MSNATLSTAAQAMVDMIEKADAIADRVISYAVGGMTRADAHALRAHVLYLTAKRITDGFERGNTNE